MTDPYNTASAAPAGIVLNDAMVTTALELPGFVITRNIGIVRGLIVRSRSVVGSIGGALQSLVGGDISIYTSLCERARQDTYDENGAARANAGCECHHRHALRRD